MRVLNTSLWELGSQLDNIDRDFQTWIPILFPPPPPPPPAAPCVPPVPCVDSQGNTTITYVATTNDSALCAPAPGSTVSHVRYTGTLCGGNNSKSIQWLSMYTLDPRPGLKPSDCTWQEPEGSVYTGYCGTCPADIRLPTQIC